MNRLALLLNKMRDANWVTRPSEDAEGQESVGPQTDIVKSEVSPGGMGAEATGQSPQPTKPINPQALTSVADTIQASEPEQSYTAPKIGETPMSKKRDKLATMGKLQTMKYPELAPKKTLAGGGYGSGIF